jgi:hypothetical protein
LDPEVEKEGKWIKCSEVSSVMTSSTQTVSNLIYAVAAASKGLTRLELVKQCISFFAVIKVRVLDDLNPNLRIRSCVKLMVFMLFIIRSEKPTVDINLGSLQLR